MIAQPDVSIIIPVFNNAELTRDCLRRVQATTADLYVETIVVDNASTDETQQMLHEFGESVRVIRNEENVGFTIASNQGARLGSGRHIVFLNNDTLPEDEWLQWLVRTAESDERVGAVGAMLVYADGVLQEAGAIIFSDGNGFNYGRGDDPHRPAYQYVRAVDYCSGACLLVKREVYDQLGGFDERYAPAYYEDADLCFGVRALGMTVLYQPRSVIVHLEGRTAGTDIGKGFKRFQAINREKFVDKWKTELARQYANDPSAVHKACHRDHVGDVLVLHPTMAAHDISAGDLRLYRILLMLRDLGARVTFVAGMSQLDERVKYVPELEQAGIEVYSTDPAHFGHPSAGNEDPYPVEFVNLLLARDFDAALLSHFNAAMLYLDELQILSPNTKTILDTVDVHYLREQRAAELHGDADHMVRAMDQRRHELVTCLRSDVVVTVTEEDRQTLLRELPSLDVRIIPVIYDSIADTHGFENRNGILFVGHFRHTPNEDAMLYFVEKVFPEVRRRLPGARLWIVGSYATDRIQRLACEDITVTGFVPETAPYLESCRVSIAPLRYGAGMKGKIAEAMQHGLPVVTTAIGAEGMRLEHGVHALIADEPGPFAEAIAQLHSDRDAWESIVGNAKVHLDATLGSAAVMAQLKDLLSLD